MYIGDAMKSHKPTTKRKSNTRARQKQSSGKVQEWAELFKPIKKPITLRLDADVLAWFKKQGSGYQTRINQVLRKIMEK
jgi:uncharacterized protein (DUF4415 family)